ncbi:hypothetical protein [Klebsiella aerogenes]|nr:hypothetical protein [Klebsiella aerogenes]
MNNVTDIQAVKWQRQRDMHTEQVQYVRDQLREVRNRLSTNKPDHDPEAA